MNAKNAALLVEATQLFKNDDSIKELRNAVASLTLALQDRPDSDETAQIQALLPNKQSSSDQNQYQRRPQFQSTQINNSSQPYNQPTRPAFRQNYRTNQYNRFENQSQYQQRPQYRPPNPAYNGPQNNFQEPRFHQQYPYPNRNRQSGFSQNQNFDSRYCFQCGLQGHIARNCPDNTTNANQNFYRGRGRGNNFH